MPEQEELIKRLIAELSRIAAPRSAPQLSLPDQMVISGSRFGVFGVNYTQVNPPINPVLKANPLRWSIVMAVSGTAAQPLTPSITQTGVPQILCPGNSTIALTWRDHPALVAGEWRGTTPGAGVAVNVIEVFLIP